MVIFSLIIPGVLFVHYGSKVRLWLSGGVYMHFECDFARKTKHIYKRICLSYRLTCSQRRSSRPPNPPIGGGPGQLWGPKLV